MTSPFTSISTSTFTLDPGTPTLNALFNTSHVKWGGPAGTGVNLTYSFPYTTSSTAAWQQPAYSTVNEPAGAKGLTVVQMDAVRAALKAWSDVANITFTEVPDTATDVGDIRFAWSDRLAASISGYAYGPDSTSAAGGDAWLSVKGLTSTDWSPGSFNFAGLLQTVGYALGLKSPSASAMNPQPPYFNSEMDYRAVSVMSAAGEPTFSALAISPLITTSTGGVRAEYPRTPTPFDIQAIQKLYGANLKTNVGDTTYTFDNSPARTLTVWDAGGNDTFDYRGTLPSVISLEAGTGSAIGVLTNWAVLKTHTIHLGDGNIQIASGVTIENAFGGSANDVLNGNSADNRLSGRGGNDSLVGMEGTDTAVYAGKMANFTITRSADNFIVTDKTGAEGVDTLINMEQIQFQDTAPIDLSLAMQALSGTVQARGASDPALAIATQMAVVYLGRPVGTDLIKALGGLVPGGQQPISAALQYMADMALKDGAFHSADTSADIVTQTFRNIMGFLPSEFEQKAWGQYIDNGTISKAEAPWIIFQSYLGATNVPAQYQLPTQARFVAAQTFSDYTFNAAAMAALNTLGGSFANAARGWLYPVDSVSHAAAKIEHLLPDITTVTIVGSAPADVF